MATLRQYFDTDFTNVLNTSGEFSCRISESEVIVIVRVHKDFDSNTKYISCFIPACSTPLDVCIALIKNVSELLTIADSVSIQVQLPGEKKMDSKDLRFSGRIFLYTVTDIPASESDKLQSEMILKDISVQFRGPIFAAKRAELERPFAFISHDSRDKDEIARPIATQLSKLMCPIWYDEFTLKVGDSLRESIEKGVKECGKCIVILRLIFSRIEDGLKASSILFSRGRFYKKTTLSCPFGME